MREEKLISFLRDFDKQTLPKDVRDDILKKTEDYLQRDYEVLRATDYLRFKQDGDRDQFQKRHFGRRTRITYMTLAYLITEEDKYFQDIINGLWLVLEESTWVVPAHNCHVVTQEMLDGLPQPHNGQIDLMSSETASLVTVVYTLLKDKFDKVSVHINERIIDEVHRRIIKPYDMYTSMWWMGYTEGREMTNWNPWINFNVLLTAIGFYSTIEKPEAFIDKIMKSLQKYIETIPEDGACPEGPLYYGVAALSVYECYELLEKVYEKKQDFLDSDLIKKACEYIVKLNIKDNKFFIVGDGTGTLKDHYGLTYRFGERVGSDRVKQFALKNYEGQRFVSIPECVHLYRAIHDLKLYRYIDKNKDKVNYSSYEYLPSAGCIMVRERTDGEGFFLGVKLGENFGSHLHNDLGSVVIYKDGLPILIDVGVGKYTKDTFSEKRYTLWTMRSSYHNLPSINGFEQAYGEGYKSELVDQKDSEEKFELTCNLQKAYPEEAGLKKFQRKIEFLKNKGIITIKDDVVKEDIIRADHIKADHKIKQTAADKWCFMLADKPKIEPGYIVIGDQCKMQYASDQLEVSYEPIHLIDDEKLMKVWGEYVYRVIFTPCQPTHEQSYEFVITNSHL